MSKKIWYSTPLKFIWENLYGFQKRLTPEIPDKYIFNILRQRMINAAQLDGGNLNSFKLAMTGLDLWSDDLKGKFLHIFFLDKQLRDFLESMPLPDLDGIKKYLFDNGKEKDVIYIKSGGQTKCVKYTFGLHIPFETNGMLSRWNFMRIIMWNFIFLTGISMG